MGVLVSHGEVDSVADRAGVNDLCVCTHKRAGHRVDYDSIAKMDFTTSCRLCGCSHFHGVDEKKPEEVAPSILPEDMVKPLLYILFEAEAAVHDFKNYDRDDMKCAMDRIMQRVARIPGVQSEVRRYNNEMSKKRRKDLS